MDRIYFSVYRCRRCGGDYMVNDGTWRECTPDLCQSCVEQLAKMYALVPIGIDGQETKQ
jgi:hypothetical protein